jgi:hypothetical protein
VPATGHLTDLKQQFAPQCNHLALVEEVLPSLICQQYEEFSRIAGANGENGDREKHRVFRQNPVRDGE